MKPKDKYASHVGPPEKFGEFFSLPEGLDESASDLTSHLGRLPLPDGFRIVDGYIVPESALEASSVVQPNDDVKINPVGEWREEPISDVQQAGRNWWDELKRVLKR